MRGSEEVSSCMYVRMYIHVAIPLCKQASCSEPESDTGCYNRVYMALHYNYIVVRYADKVAFRSEIL